MADLRISQMPAAVSLDSADLLPVVQGGLNKQATFATVDAYLKASQQFEFITEPAALLPTGISLLQAGVGGVLNVLLPAGVERETKTLIAETALSEIHVAVAAGVGFNRLNLQLAGSTAELVFVNGSWYIKCLHLATQQLI